MSDSFKIINGDCIDWLYEAIDEIHYLGLLPVIVTDPPFNIGYHYHNYCKIAKKRIASEL